MTTSTVLEAGSGAHSALPLSAYPVHRSADLDETRAWMEGVGDRPVRLKQSGRSPSGIAFNIGAWGGISLAFDSYRADLDSEVERYPGDPFLVMLPIVGPMRVALGPVETVTTPDLAAVISPAGPLSIRYGAGTRTLQVRIDQTTVQARLRKMVGSTATRPVSFPMAFDLSSAKARTWRSLIDLVVADLDTNDGIASSPLAATSVENMLLDGFLLSHEHSYSEQLTQPRPRPRPRTVQRAVEVINDHWQEPLSTADLAEAVGVSARALQDGFHAHLNTTPMAYLRRVRLYRIREVLLASDPATTSVTRVALDGGLTHLGRFAQSYRVEFGEAPSETLRRGR